MKTGFFENNNICYERVFEAYNPPKPVRDSIKKEYKLKGKQIKAMFNRLVLGDTVSIPYYGTSSYDGTGRTRLNPYSYAYFVENFDCIIKGVITAKNKHKGGYNIVYRLIDCSNCNYDKIVLNGKELTNGELIEFNMRYLKVLDNK